MKRHLCVWMVVCLGCGWLVSPSHAGSKKATRLSIKPGTQDVLSAVSLTFDVGGNTNCAVLLTGPATLQTEAPVVTGSINVIASAIVSMHLTGQLPDGSPVEFLAGQNLVGLPSTGSIVSTNGLFPADSYYDVNGLIRLPGGTNLVNTVVVRIQTTLTAYPSVSQIYTNLNQSPLADATNTSNVVGQLEQLTFLGAQAGKQTTLGFSIDVAGTNGLGSVTLHECPAGSAPSVTATLKLTDLNGAVVANLGCDEIIGTNLLFAAKLTKNLRVPDWRGSHSGNWIMYTLSGSGKTNLVAAGTMAGSDGAGSHRAPVIVSGGENCSECTRFEGSLQGKILEKSAFRGARLHAAYVGQFVDDQGVPVGCCPGPGAPPHGPVRLAIDGAVTTSCQPAP